MTRTQFDAWVEQIRSNPNYQQVTELEQKETIAVALTELPDLLEALDLATRDELAGFWPDLAEQIGQYPSAKAAYESIPELHTALDERDARRYLTRHLEESVRIEKRPKGKLRGDGHKNIVKELTEDVEVPVTLAELLAAKPELATGPSNHLPVLVQFIWQFCNPNQSDGEVPHEDLDAMFWVPQFGSAFPWAELPRRLVPSPSSTWDQEGAN